MNEEWKVVEGYEGKYSVSNHGRVWNNYADKEVAQVLTGKPKYKYVNMKHPSPAIKRTLERVHRLVALAFIPVEEGYDMVDHIDRDKMNNHVSNLRWTDRAGNGRNLDNNRYIGDKLLIELIEERYGSKDPAYSTIKNYADKGYSWEDCVKEYERYLEHGRKSFRVVWEGEEVFLADLCKKFNKDYLTVRVKLQRGWDIWNAIYDVCPNNGFSFTLKRDYGCVYVWIPSKDYLLSKVPYGKNKLNENLESGLTYEEVMNYDVTERYNRTVVGFTGRIDEIYKHFNVTENMVNTRMQRQGMTFEEAVTTPRQRIRYVTVSGERVGLKYFVESYGVNAKDFNKYRSENKVSLEDAFEKYGIDYKSLDLKY
jgi:hypothetical protein